MHQRKHPVIVLLLTVSLFWGCQFSPRPAARAATDGVDVPGHFYVGLPTAEEQQAVKTFVLSLTPEQVRKANAYTKSSPEGLYRWDRGKGLPYAELTDQQKQAVEVLWAREEERLNDLVARKSHLREKLVPGPLEQVEVFNVGYYLIPEETREHTLLSFLCTSFPVATRMETTLPGVIELTPALEAEGLDLREWNRVISRDLERMPPEFRAKVEMAEQEAPPANTD